MKTNFTGIPIVDFSLSHSDPPKYFEQLRFALEDVGFVVFVNVPGFEDSFQKKLFARAEYLFSKPQTWKDALGTQNSYALRGYFRADDISGPHQVCEHRLLLAILLIVVDAIGICRSISLRG